MRYFENPYDDYGGGTVTRRSRTGLQGGLQEVCSKIYAGTDSVLRSMDGGVYVGPAGVAYSLWRVQQSGILADSGPALLKKADELIQMQVQFAEKRRSKGKTGERVGFLIGHAGAHAIDAVVGQALGDSDRVTRAVARFNDIVPLAKEGICDSDELLVGRAGYICGGLWLRKALSSPGAVSDASLTTVCDAMLASGIAYSKQTRSPSPLMYEYYDTEYLGAAHGLCSILQMFLSVPGYIDRQGVRKLVEDSIEYLLSIQTAEGNFPCAMDEVPGIGRSRSSDDELVHWCHGAPGTIYLLVRAFLVLKKDSYLSAALRCGDLIWSKGLLRKGPGICHGVSGNAYAFLLLYRTTRDEKHLHRAYKFADFMETSRFKDRARTPDCPLSLYEGLAGKACFLADLANPEESAFPFFDVFDP